MLYYKFIHTKRYLSPRSVLQVPTFFIFFLMKSNAAPIYLNIKIKTKNL